MQFISVVKQGMKRVVVGGDDYDDVFCIVFRRNII